MHDGLNFSYDPRRANSRSNSSTYIYSVWLSFIPAVGIFVSYLITSAVLANTSLGTFAYVLLVLILFALGNTIGYMVLASLIQLSIYWRSSLLCNTFLVGFIVANQPTYPALVCFGYYMMCLSFFHLSEFVFTALFNQDDVKTDSFLLNHSLEYGIAAFASWTEFFIELLVFPSLKTSLYTRLLGLSLVLFGEAFRKMAMYTAGKNFNHYVQEQRKSDHVLVKTGIYSLIRHPSYFGWFYWSIGTQILLANPVCTVLYAVASWKFFKSRIVYEEFYLIKFFGKEYSSYQRKVPSGIPFVSGYVVYAEESLD